MSVLDEEISKEDFLEISSCMVKKGDCSELVKKIYKPLQMNYVEITELEPSGMLFEKGSENSSVGIYVGTLNNQTKKIFVFLRFDIDNVMGSFSYFSLHSSYEEGIKDLEQNGECEYMEWFQK